MDKVYIETSIVSYASAWPSRDIETAARQQQARDWWAIERPKFQLVTSQLTLDEASVGDADAAADRLKLLDGLPLVDINSDAEALAAKLLGAHTMPQKAAADALHVAAAALGGVKYLLTLNCKHIANAHELPRIYDLLNREGIGQMLICTPAEFLGVTPMIKKQMIKKQPILDELHAVREQLLAESGGTLAGLVARLRAEQAKSGRTIIEARRTSACTCGLEMV